MQLFQLDTSGALKTLPKTVEISVLIISIYTSLTIVCSLAYWLQGMSVFDSIAHSFTTLATGGFSLIMSRLDFSIIQELKLLQQYLLYL